MTGQEARDLGAARLRIVRLAVLGLGLVLALRVLQVQVFEHDRWLARANSQWSREVVLDPERGNLYDRNGRPLAVSVATTQLGVTGRFFEDNPALMADLVEVSGLKEADIRARLRKAGDGHAVLGSGIVLEAGQLQRLRRWKCVTLDERCSRYYPTDGMAASIIGFYRQDPTEVHAMGLEYSLEKELAGKPGKAREIQTAQPGVKLGRIVLQNATHGRSLVLTLDAGLQEICEERLKEAVTAANARGGSVLVLDPSNGDVLAAASWPLVDTRANSQPDGTVWNNRNFTTAFEPGSLFKVFSGAALLHHGAVDTGTVINCNNNSGAPGGINNDKNHDYGYLSFGGALAHSSNVYFAKASLKIDDEDFYRDLASFGFGERTKYPYGAQPRGLLHKPEKWNGSDKPCISIGQAVSVTALQLGMGLCAVANGGTLYAPRCIKGIRGRDSGAIEEVQPVALRRIMAPPLAEVLRGAMARVVREGTAKSIAMDWVEAGGKTGTAQKAREGGGGYEAGAYMASFGGIVPVDNPRLVVLVVVDEPDRAHHYASQSAAPLFRAVVEDIRRCSDWLSDVPGGKTGPVLQPDPLRLVEIPDVLYLRAANAHERLASAGLRVGGDEGTGTVVGQVPAAGTRCEAGTTVSLSIVGGRPSQAKLARLAKAAREREEAAAEQAARELKAKKGPKNGKPGTGRPGSDDPLPADPAATDLALAPPPPPPPGALDVCPDFKGMSTRQVLSEAARVGVKVILNGVGYASAQDIAPGSPRPDGPVTVTLETTWN